VVLLVIPSGGLLDPMRGFRRAGVALFVLAAVYPFFVPTLGLAAVLYALVSVDRMRWASIARALITLLAFPMLAMLYWAVLPVIDAEYARFAAGNRQPLFSPLIVTVSLGLSAGAIIGIPLLLRGNAYQKMLGCLAAASIVMLYVPAHPWRSHIFYLSPFLIIAGVA